MSGSNPMPEFHFFKYLQNDYKIEGQKVKYHIEGCNKYGLPKLKFTEPVDPKVFYHYMPGTTVAHIFIIQIMTRKEQYVVRILKVI